MPAARPGDPPSLSCSQLASADVSHQQKVARSLLHNLMPAPNAGAKASASMCR